MGSRRPASTAAGNAQEQASERPPLRSVGGLRDWGDTSRAMRSRASRLSRKELLVLGELARGGSTESIGEALYVSPHTVRTHIKNILRKLDAKSRAHAVAIGLTEGVIEL